MAWPISGLESSWTKWMPGTVSPAWSGQVRRNSRTGRAKVLPGSARQAATPARRYPSAWPPFTPLSRYPDRRRLFWLALGWTAALAWGKLGVWGRL
jgi:hypothetical protein